jgi:protocatechuate 3,4-dioxygenase beta subunit
MHTDAEGRYEYRTIRPGPYPGGGVPAHVHYVVSAPGFRERVFEIVFDDDPLVDAEIRQLAARPSGGFALCTPTRDAGRVWHCTQDVRLQR